MKHCKEAENLTCPKCKNEFWIIRKTGVRCDKCGYWMSDGEVMYISSLDTEET